MAFGKGKTTKTLVWILMAMLLVGLAGFGATNLSSSARSVATVGEKDVSVDAYVRALRNELNALGAQAGRTVTLAEAKQLGIDRRVLGQLLTARGLDNEAARIGLSVGDEEVARQIREIPAFKGANGAFDRESYRFALRNNGLDEGEFEEQLRDETARNLLQAALISAVSLPDTYVDTLLAYGGETRDFTWAVLDESNLTTGMPVPTEADLKKYYDENIAEYTLPETKSLTYIWLTPDMILDTVELDEAALRAAYQERSDEFNQPERRLVERLIFPDEAAAEAAKARIDGGESFETIVTERGLELSDIDLGDVSKADLGEAGDGVFSLSVGEVSPPLPSDLGPALYRVNGVLAAHSTSFEDALPALREDLALDRARRVIDQMIQDIDDKLAAGATLEEVANETDAQLGQIDWFDGADGADGDIAGYDAFNAAAAKVTAEDFPAVAQLGDGGIFALRLDALHEPAPEPFEDVVDRVRQGWETRELTSLLTKQAEELAASIASGRSFEDANLTPNAESGLVRTAQLTDLPSSLIPAVFDMSVGEARAIAGTGAAYIVRLDAVHAADRDNPELQNLAKALREQASSDVSQDIFRAVAIDIQTRAGLSINQAAINAVQANFQ